MSEQGAVPMIVMAKSQDHVEAINSTLRKAGHPVHCTWLPDAARFGRRPDPAQSRDADRFHRGTGCRPGLAHEGQTAERARHAGAHHARNTSMRRPSRTPCAWVHRTWSRWPIAAGCNPSPHGSCAPIAWSARCRPPCHRPASTASSCRISWKARPTPSRTCRKASSWMPIGRGWSCSAIPATMRSPASR